MDLKTYIRDVPDFPKPGIIFKDITPLLRAPEALKSHDRAVTAEDEHEVIQRARRCVTGRIAELERVLWRRLLIGREVPTGNV